MLDIGLNNLFIADTSSKYGVIKVLEYYDLDGINWIFLHRDKSNMKHMIRNHKIIYTPSKLHEVFANSNNLFKVDMIVFECDIDISHIIREQTKIPIILISNNIFKFNPKDYDYIYEFHFEYVHGLQIKPFDYGKYTVNSLQENKKQLGYSGLIVKEKYNLNDIYLSKVRDKKIDNLLD